MTLTVDLHVQSNPVRVERDCIRAESIGSEEVALQGSGAAHRGGVRPSFEFGGMSGVTRRASDWFLGHGCGHRVWGYAGRCP